MPKMEQAQVIDVPHRVGELVSIGGPNAITEDHLDRTDRNLIANFGGQYREWVTNDLADLTRLLGVIAHGMASDADEVEEPRALLHEMRAMGGTFNFDLVTAIGDQMYRLITNCEHIDADRLSALRVHLASLKLVIAKDLTGDGGRRGREMMGGLQRVYEKIA
ncbi:MAG: hypothetical protein HOH04_12740 [Rhodospirillaceae bacterium]|jgi:hypothetical protein|nr:hypothetical protein [Rhodospirillaceae bacterium]